MYGRAAGGKALRRTGANGKTNVTDNMSQDCRIQWISQMHLGKTSNTTGTCQYCRRKNDCITEAADI